jgi:hypothetical protein
MSDESVFYRRRIEEESAAASSAVDPDIAQIHRQIAQQYRERMNGDSERNDDAAVSPQSSGGSVADRAIVFG